MKRLLALVLLTALVVLLPRPAASETPYAWSPAPWPAAVIPSVFLGVDESDQRPTGAPVDPAIAQLAERRLKSEVTGAEPVRGANAGAPSPAVASTRPTPRVSVPATASDVVFDGLASTYGPGWNGWIAWPAGPGYELRVCGPGGCRVVTSTDAGPDLAMQRKGRIIDLDVPTFEAVCGANWRMGLCQVEVTILRVPR